ncbi:MAG TPA: precorrin-8X methylmutase [Candidatus Angelobacter sp.]|jgi:precorrin-8X/cobalt-precorrin-8 methylmutase|nr:precorrin-8X methylmutase [Candidatus Angelobacter sp.]
MMVRATGEGLALRAHGLPPDEIMPLSLERLRRRSPVELPPEPAATVALRMAYAAGDPDLLRDIVIHDGAVRAAQAALQRGAALVCDVAMVAAGVRGAVERGGSRVFCAQDVAEVPLSGHHVSPATRAAADASTRTARGLLNLAAHWEGAVVAIGNAPTALLALLDALADGAPLPAALIATPCGLVAAEEAKQLLLDTAPLPFITVRGTRGGSAVAAAAVNACALL